MLFRSIFYFVYEIVVLNVVLYVLLHQSRERSAQLVERLRHP